MSFGSMSTFKNHFEQAAELIANADALVIAAGAGIGVDSGLPDFRGNAGFWNAYPALAKAHINFTDIANPRAFSQHPELAWGFYGHRLDLYRKTVPHAGFGILRNWADAKNGSWVFTSNVDGQFQKAGFSPKQIHECHGSIHHLQCMNECTTEIWSADDFMPDVDEENCLLLNEPPRCPRCGATARPNILMFGDWSWSPRRTALQSQRKDEWLAAIGDHQRVVVVELGAGTAIPSVRNFSQRIIYEFGGRLVRINPREFQVPSSVDVGIPMGSLEALRGIDEALGAEPPEMDLDFT